MANKCVHVPKSRVVLSCVCCDGFIREEGLVAVVKAIVVSEVWCEWWFVFEWNCSGYTPPYTVEHLKYRVCLDVRRVLSNECYTYSRLHYRLTQRV